jgi:hypothetical protein
MNIFVLDRDPSIAAMFHNNRHCSKMILEHTQMLCTTLNLLGITTPYKTVHKNHPCRLWVGESRSNFLWLCELTKKLGEEFTYRYGKKHKSIDVMEICLNHNESLPEKPMTPFALAMPDEYKATCPVESYRNYYNGAKRHLADWGSRNSPYWYQF